MSKVRLIGKNIRFMAISRILTIIISFFIFPFIIHHIGKETYGVYIIVLTVTSYFGLLDLGIMSALTKYVSEYNGKKDEVAISRIINASFSFYVAIGLVIATLLFICIKYFPIFFKISAANTPITRQLFLVAGISALLIWPLNTFKGTIQGINLWSVDAIANASVQACNAVAAYLLLSHGHGIVSLFIASQTITILSGLCIYWIAKRRVHFIITFPYIEIATFKFIFNFSFFVFLSSVLGVIIFQVHNLIIGYFISMSAVTTYAVAYNIQSYFRTINSTIGAPPWTIASEMEGMRDYEGQRQLLLKGTKYTSAVFLPIVVIMLFFVEPFIRYWMGPGFQESILPARVIIFFWLFNGTTSIASGFLSAKGMVKKPLLIELLIAAFNITISLSLIKMLGITAMALGLTSSMVLIGSPLLLRLALKAVGMTSGEYIKKAINGNVWLYLFAASLSLFTLTYYYPKNIYITLLEMGVLYGISLAGYYLFLLNGDGRREVLKLAGLESKVL